VSAVTCDPKELNLVAEGDEQSANIMKRAGDTLGSERRDKGSSEIGENFYK